MVSEDKMLGPEGPAQKFIQFLFSLIEKPVIWFREQVVEPNRKEYYWYHEQLRRVPTIDQCYTDDIACIYEANEQHKRDRMVDRYILEILHRRQMNCLNDNMEDPEDCEHLKKIFEEASTNYFIKYGDLGWKDTALNCYMKQKNRMAWERRHGPVGSGGKAVENNSNE